MNLAKLKNIKIAPPIFIVGHWRSGTTFLQYLMGQDKNLAFVSTMTTMAPWIFLGSEKIFKPFVEKHLPGKRPMDDLEMRATLPYEDEYAIANFSPYSFYHGWYFPRKIDYHDYVLREIAKDDLRDLFHIKGWTPIPLWDFVGSDIALLLQGMAQKDAPPRAARSMPTIQ